MIVSVFNDFCVLLLFLIPQTTVGETDQQTSDCDTYRRDTKNTEKEGNGGRFSLLVDIFHIEE